MFINFGLQWVLVNSIHSWEIGIKLCHKIGSDAFKTNEVYANLIYHNVGKLIFLKFETEG